MGQFDGEVAIVGAGIAGLATAYYLASRHRVCGLILLDPEAPMSLTSAQSGENYRNWWPHPVMTRFTNDSIGLMEGLARASGNRFHMTRRGYALATRQDGDALIAELHAGYGAAAGSLIRVHETAGGDGYRPSGAADWDAAPDGVDVLRHRALIARAFPSFAPEVATVLHIRRAGDISSQQLGQLMLEEIRAAGGRLLRGRAAAIAQGSNGGRFTLEVTDRGQHHQVRADAVVNAAGPFAGEVARLLGVELPLFNVLQQKVAFEDTARAIPRDLPFAIDLDAQRLDWTQEEHALLVQDPDTAWLAETLPGAVHCRPDGGAGGRWIRLGWAYNRTRSQAARQPPLDAQFPEIVLRGAARLSPALRAYYGRFPRRFTHYGGYYTMTEENWPLIGPMGRDGAFVVAALSGFGTMAACAAGALCAAHLAGTTLPDYADSLSLARHRDAGMMAELTAAGSKGIL